MKKKQHEGQPGQWLIILAGICWGLIGLFSNYLADNGLNPVRITFLRSSVAAAGLWIYLGIFHRDGFENPPQRFLDVYWHRRLQYCIFQYHVLHND